jgi:hypoxanthine phosphoribosyltransferase
VPIQAIGLSLYEDLGQEEKEKESSGPTSMGKMGTTVIRTQWLDAPKREGKDGQLAGGLLGKNILIVDEVDDSRTTLRWVVKRGEVIPLSPAEHTPTISQICIP